MRVKLFTRGAGPEGIIPPGTVIEADDEEAASLVANYQGAYTLEPVTVIERATVDEQREAATSRVQRPSYPDG